ncbi:CBS domain-containing protein [Micromonospora sp. CPCC 206061]|uniref:CBS domain-containing protein n=1 Tax=Micromonospora sp. CPCC 206061 TaxID=3122410 RepID=UPI002FEF1A33
MTQTVRDVMTPGPVTVAPDATLIDAAQQMRDKDIGDVLVVDLDGHLRGIVTDRDIVVRALADGREARVTMVGDVCSPDPVSVAPDDDVERAVDMMRGKAVRRLPVVENGRLVGVVSLGDMAIERDPQSALGQISAAAENN